MNVLLKSKYFVQTQLIQQNSVNYFFSKQNEISRYYQAIVLYINKDMLNSESQIDSFVSRIDNLYSIEYSELNQQNSEMQQKQPCNPLVMIIFEETTQQQYSLVQKLTRSLYFQQIFILNNEAVQDFHQQNIKALLNSQYIQFLIQLYDQKFDTILENPTITNFFKCFEKRLVYQQKYNQIIQCLNTQQQVDQIQKKKQKQKQYNHAVQQLIQANNQLIISSINYQQLNENSTTLSQIDYLMLSDSVDLVKLGYDMANQQTQLLIIFAPPNIYLAKINQSTQHIEISTVCGMRNVLYNQQEEILNLQYCLVKSQKQTFKSNIKIKLSDNNIQSFNKLQRYTHRFCDHQFYSIEEQIKNYESYLTYQLKNIYCLFITCTITYAYKLLRLDYQEQQQVIINDNILQFQNYYSEIVEIKLTNYQFNYSQLAVNDVVLLYLTQNEHIVFYLFVCSNSTFLNTIKQLDLDQTQIEYTAQLQSQIINNLVYQLDLCKFYYYNFLFQFKLDIQKLVIQHITQVQLLSLLQLYRKNNQFIAELEFIDFQIDNEIQFILTALLSNQKQSMKLNRCSFEAQVFVQLINHIQQNKLTNSLTLTSCTVMNTQQLTQQLSFAGTINIKDQISTLLKFNFQYTNLIMGSIDYDDVCQKSALQLLAQLHKYLSHKQNQYTTQDIKLLLSLNNMIQQQSVDIKQPSTIK